MNNILSATQIMLDPANLRMITTDNRASSIVNIWDLNTYDWTGGFYMNSYNRKWLQMNSRYLFVADYAKSEVYDFQL